MNQNLYINGSTLYLATGYATIVTTGAPITITITSPKIVLAASSSLTISANTTFAGTTFSNYSATVGSLSSNGAISETNTGLCMNIYTAIASGTNITYTFPSYGFYLVVWSNVDSITTQGGTRISQIFAGGGLSLSYDRDSNTVVLGSPYAGNKLVVHRMVAY